MLVRLAMVKAVESALIAGLLFCAPLQSSASLSPTADSPSAASGSEATSGEAASDNLATAAEPRTPNPTRTRLSDNAALYPRAIQLAHNGDADGRILASATTFTDRGGEAAIFESSDDGANFTQIASIPMAEHNGQPGLCCGTLYELPQAVGDLAEGTLLYAASVGQEAGDARRMSMDIWQSSDQGRNWSYLSACATAPNNGGLWEPEFSIDAQGRLICHYADETDDVDGTQRLVQVASTDGVNWQDRQINVQSLPESTRPGMPVVRQLPSGEYLMTYEICGQPGQNGQYDCATYLRRSADGGNWGDPDDRGTLLTSEADRYFTHAPTFAVASDGTLLLVGQQLRESDGAVAAGSGRTVFVNAEAGNGPWREIAAPVEVPNPPNEPCPNYSSTLTPLSGTSNFLEIATDTDPDGECRAYFGTGTYG